MPGRLMIDRIDDFRRTGTNFYVLCFRNKGEKDTKWSTVVDKIYNVTGLSGDTGTKNEVSDYAN